MSKEVLSKSFEAGMNFEDFLKKTEEFVANTDATNLSEDDLFIYNYTKLNLQRMRRVLKTHGIEEELAAKIKAIDKKQNWMIITENWCGDSAQSSPEFYKMSLLNSNIDLRIVERDTFPEVMDMYLTDGKKSIPIIVAFDENWEQLWKWGARPKILQDQINEWTSQDLPKDEWIEKIHLWYGKNKGKEVFAEMNFLLL
ncbi:thioredoxin family protein [Ignavibacteriales bacterium]